MRRFEETQGRETLHPVMGDGDTSVLQARHHKENRVNTIKRKIWVIFHRSGRVLKDRLAASVAPGPRRTREVQVDLYLLWAPQKTERQGSTEEDF